MNCNKSSKAFSVDSAYSVIREKKNLPKKVNRSPESLSQLHNKNKKKQHSSSILELRKSILRLAREWNCSPKAKSMTSDPNHDWHAWSIFYPRYWQTHPSRRWHRGNLNPISRNISCRREKAGSSHGDVGEGVIWDEEATHPLTVPHHSSHLISDQEFLRHVLHMLQGVGSCQRATLFDPGAGFPRGGEELERATLLFI